MGNAEIALKDADPAEYDFDLEVDLGKITINGEKQKNEYRKDGSGDKEIRIENDLGNIEIKM